MHSLSNKEELLIKMPASGTYVVKNGQLKMISRNIYIHELKSREEFILQRYVPEDVVIKPGGRLVNLLFNDSAIDLETDKLYNDTSNIIKLVRQDIVAKIREDQ